MPKRRKIEVIERGLGREKCDGLAWIDEDKIEIEKSLCGRERLLVLVHELVHLCDETISEKNVLKYDQLIGGTLWDLGYRLVELE